MRHRTKSLLRSAGLLLATVVPLGGVACNAIIGAELGELRDVADGLPDAEVSGPGIDGSTGTDGAPSDDAGSGVDGGPSADADVDAAPDLDAGDADVDAGPPPTVTFTTTPPDPSPATSVTFGYTITGATGDALCKLDTPGSAGTFATCNDSATTVATPSVGKYTFTVRASNGVTSTDAAYTWNKCTIPSPPAAFGYTGSIVSYVVPTTCMPDIIRIEVWGAEGGAGASPSPAIENLGGKGARMRGDFTGFAGVKLGILVGQKGESRGLPNGFNGGGGGGSFVWLASDQKPLVIAGGGGGGGGVNNTTNTFHVGADGQASTNGTNGKGMGTGAGTNGSGGVDVKDTSNDVWSGGGAGWLSNGANGFNAIPTCGTAGGGKRPLDGGYGGLHGTSPGDTLGNGGFGGGGGAQGNCGAGGGGGGGGGYSGGGGGSSNASYGYMGGGGGGSYNVGDKQSNSAGVRTGNGQVVISW